MDVFSGFSIEAFQYSIWIVAIVVFLLLAISYPRAKTRQIVSLVLKSLLGAAIAFFAASLAIVFYILAHATDRRWSEGKDSAIESPELSAGVPLFDGIVDTLNRFMGSMTGSVNDVLAIKNAFLSTTDFLLMAGWGLIAVVLVGIPVWVMGILDERWRKRQLDEVIHASTEHARELDEIRNYVGMKPKPRK